MICFDFVADEPRQQRRTLERPGQVGGAGGRVMLRVEVGGFEGGFVVVEVWWGGGLGGWRVWWLS